ncbi:uncharacterized protein LOC123682778 [Harmonia axyridis]|uniref:uncharacterized protein LOC123682778 n=1 Tax=Harmonia axyridis TaxID=115357 RepID=UPI001E2792E9|nr:uncharacterized protein LOC123682778 [Harmonia axyridis]
MNFELGFFLVVFILLAVVTESAVTEKKRKKLYISFPKGATLSVQICLTYQMGVTPGSIFTEAVNWGINYPLEIKEEMKMDMEQTPEEKLLRREKRGLFSRMEKLFYHMGYHGRDCILRAICEFSSIFGSADKTMERELLKIFFEYTSLRNVEYESKEDLIYHQAQKIGEEMNIPFCVEKYPKCHFSLIDVLTGRNSVENLLEYMR